MHAKREHACRNRIFIARQNAKNSTEVHIYVLQISNAFKTQIKLLQNAFQTQVSPASTLQASREL